jgi:hypothetical protein
MCQQIVEYFPPTPIKIAGTVNLGYSWLDIITFLISIITLIVLAKYTWDTSKIAKETKGARMDAHLPILKCKSIQVISSNDKYVQITFNLQLLQEQHFNLNYFQLNNEKKFTPPYNLINEGPILGKQYSVKLSSPDIIKGENIFTIFYTDIYNRKLLLTIKFDPSIITGGRKNSSGINSYQIATPYSMMKFEE